MWRILTVLLLIGLTAPIPAPAQAQGVGRQLVETIDGPDGQPRRVIFLLPPEPTAAVLLFPGGDGVVGIGTTGFVRYEDNFLVRTRALWRSENLAVALPDTPAGTSLLGRRGSADFADAAAAILARLRALTGSVPIFLVGTSQGSTGAANLAAALPPGRIAGLVLNSPVSQRNAGGETVYDGHPEQVAVPSLIVVHAADTCRLSPPGEAAKLAATLAQAARHDILRIEAPSPLRGPACGPFAPHGYLNAEGTTVRQITAWMRRISPKP